MIKPIIRECFKPQVVNPIFIVGLPGIGNVGKLALKTLLKDGQAKIFAEMYSPFFPSFVLAKKGVCRLPRYEFWASSSMKPNFIALTGDYQPSYRDVTSHYIVCGEILDFIKKFGCTRVITLGGVRVKPEERGKIFMTGNTSSILGKLRDKGIKIYSGKIIGASGLILGMAKLHRLSGICILGGVLYTTLDEIAAHAIYKSLIQILAMDLL